LVIDCTAWYGKCHDASRRSRETSIIPLRRPSTAESPSQHRTEPRLLALTTHRSSTSASIRISRSSIANGWITGSTVSNQEPRGSRTDLAASRHLTSKIHERRDAGGVDSWRYVTVPFVSWMQEEDDIEHGLHSNGGQCCRS